MKAIGSFIKFFSSRFSFCSQFVPILPMNLISSNWKIFSELTRDLTRGVTISSSMIQWQILYPVLVLANNTSLHPIHSLHQFARVKNRHQHFFRSIAFISSRTICSMFRRTADNGKYVNTCQVAQHIPPVKKFMVYGRGVLRRLS